MLIKLTYIPPYPFLKSIINKTNRKTSEVKKSDGVFMLETLFIYTLV